MNTANRSRPDSRPRAGSELPEREVEKTWYRTPRLTLPIPGVREFQLRYEAAVPDLPLAAVEDLVSRKVPWSEMVELIERSAPHGFLIYFRNDVHPVMALAGDQADCVAYLMGNHVIAERMFRHDPRAMMYAPLHTVIWEDRRGDAWFTVDQPSKQFASFDIPEIAEVGIELDHKLAGLLDALAVPAPHELSE
jgi:uncharacterized protein (DUF302 family)